MQRTTHVKQHSEKEIHKAANKAFRVHFLQLNDYLNGMCTQKQNKYKPFFLTAYRVPGEEERKVKTSISSDKLQSQNLNTFIKS